MLCRQWCISLFLIGYIQDSGTELVEEGTLQRFGEEVTNHFLSRAVFNSDFIASNSIGDEVVSNMYVSCALAARRCAILFEQDGALIVLV